TSVTVTGLGSLSVATFAVTRQTGVAATAASSGAVTGSRFTVSVTGVTVHLGTDGAQLDISGGSLDLYSFKTATLAWLATTGSGFGLTAVLGPVSISTSGVALHLGTDGAQLDITGGKLDLYSFKTPTLAWLATTGSGFGLTAVLGPVSISTSGVAFQYNSGPAGDAIVDWGFAGGPTFPSG